MKFCFDLEAYNTGQEPFVFAKLILKAEISLSMIKN